MCVSTLKVLKAVKMSYIFILKHLRVIDVLRGVKFLAGMIAWLICVCHIGRARIIFNVDNDLNINHYIFMTTKTLVRQTKFAKAYVENGCNGTKAYQSISPGVTYMTAAVEANAYLKKPKVNEIILEEIAAVPIGHLRKRFMDMSFDSKRDADKLRSLEDIAKLEGLMRDNNITINNANGFSLEDIRKVREEINSEIKKVEALDAPSPVQSA